MIQRKGNKKESILIHFKIKFIIDSRRSCSGSCGSVVVGGTGCSDGGVSSSSFCVSIHFLIMNVYGKKLLTD